MIAAVVLLVALVAVAVAYARHAARPARGLHSFDVPPPVPVDLLRGEATPNDYRRAGRPAAVLELPPGALTADQVRRFGGVTAAEAAAGVDAFARTVTAGGRHRRPDGELPPGALGMTGIMRKLDADAIAADARMQRAVDVETGRIPKVRGR